MGSGEVGEGQGLDSLSKELVYSTLCLQMLCILRYPIYVTYEIQEDASDSGWRSHESIALDYDRTVERPLSNSALDCIQAGRRILLFPYGTH